jgi:hypothetical protein
MNTATPALTATFTDPDPNDTGTLTFEVCGNATCTAGGDPISTFSTASGIANSTNGTASVPGGAITRDGKYYWRARGTDSTSVASCYGATLSCIVDTTAPTITAAVAGRRHGELRLSAVRHAPGVAGSVFSVNGIAGTGTVTYPAANQTRFTLAAAVHHLMC